MKILEVFTKNRIIGNLGEREAVKHLRKSGYRILEKNYVALGYEIDVIARKKNVTAFVEVKARNVKHLGHYEARPASAVTPEKQRKANESWRECTADSGRSCPEGPRQWWTANVSRKPAVDPGQEGAIR